MDFLRKLTTRLSSPVSPTTTTEHRQQKSLHNRTTFPAVQSQVSFPIKRRFQRSAVPLQDIAVLHVAYLIRDFLEMQELILAIVRISDASDVRFCTLFAQSGSERATSSQLKDVVDTAVLFTVDLIAALDMKAIPNGTDKAIRSFLACVVLVVLNHNKHSSLALQCNKIH